MGGAFHKQFVKHTKKMYGPNTKTFRVGPIHQNFPLRQAGFSHHTRLANPHVNNINLSSTTQIYRQRQKHYRQRHKFIVNDTNLSSTI